MAFRDLFRIKPPAPPAPRLTPADIDDLIKRREFRDAARLLRQLLRSRPDSLATRVKLAYVLARSGERADSVTEYLAVAEAHAEQQRFDRAVQTMQLALSALPANPLLMRRRKQLERLRAAWRRLDGIERRMESRLIEAEGIRSVTGYDLRALWSELGLSRLVTELDDDLLGLLFAAGNKHACTTHTSLARVGQNLPLCCVVLRGAVAARAGLEGEDPVLHEYGPGEVFGLEQLLDGTRWPADYRAARDDTITLQLGRRELERMRPDGAAPRLIEHLRRLDHARPPGTTGSPTDH